MLPAVKKEESRQLTMKQIKKIKINAAPSPTRAALFQHLLFVMPNVIRGEFDVD